MLPKCFTKACARRGYRSSKCGDFLNTDAALSDVRDVGRSGSSTSFRACAGHFRIAPDFGRIACPRIISRTQGCRWLP